ncbi:MAG: AraC family transcriptional regulator [Rhodospirillaceae bacterium]
MTVDVLSDVLRAVRLTGAVYYDFKLTSPWVAQAPPTRIIAPVVMPGVQHVMEYHVLTDGACWGGLLDGEPWLMEAGDVIVFPHGDPHAMSSSPGMRAEPDMSIVLPPNDRLPFVFGGGGGGPDRAHLICGFLGCDRMPFNPLLAALPRAILLKSRHGPDPGWLDRFIDLVRREVEDRRAGSRDMLSRLAEIMFVDVVRRHLDQVPEAQAGWLAGLQDVHVGRALAALHARPAHAWTLEELAAEAGLSRSVFAERFMQLLGLPPIQYLARWRMQMAATLLAQGSESIALIAVQVGYDSEAAFSRAFKKMVGLAPGAWRRRKSIGPG